MTVLTGEKVIFFVIETNYRRNLAQNNYFEVVETKLLVLSCSHLLFT
jgi:hypothetical protein